MGRSNFRHTEDDDLDGGTRRQGFGQTHQRHEIVIGIGGYQHPDANDFSRKADLGNTRSSGVFIYWRRSGKELLKRADRLLECEPLVANLMLH